MRKKLFNGKQGKRAVYAGLFLGMLLGLCGCDKTTVRPEETGTPEPTSVGTVTPRPDKGTPTPWLSAPADTPSPVPSPLPVLPTREPEPTPEAAPGITFMPLPVPSAAPTPEATKTPEPAPTSEIRPEPAGTGAVTQVPTATPAPASTAQPDYDTLLQNGWQRVEDFFGCRDIYFSGRFNHTELVAAPGRYEYRYSSAEEPGVMLSVIGEEALTVQRFLEDLTQKVEECLVLREGEADYRYTYYSREAYVNGRVYACYENGREHRMRVEVTYPVSTETQTEGYEFYLR